MISSVPFLIPGVHAGLVDVEGIVRVDGEELVLDLRIVDGLVGMLKSRPNEVRIPLKHVEALEYKGGFFRGKLRLRVRNLEYLMSVPGSDGAEVVLKCKRRYRRLAHEFATLVTLRLLEGNFTDEGAPARV